VKQVANKETGNFEGEGLTIVFLDDFVGSGGQFSDYLPKFIGRHLREQIFSVLYASERNIDSALQSTSDALQRLSEAVKEERLSIHVVFATGVHGALEDKLLKQATGRESDGSWQRFRWPFSLPLESRVEFEKGRSPKVAPTKDPHATSVEFRATVHIAEVQPNVECVLGAAGKDQLERELRKKYMYIAEGRESELPCDFEPLGWKGNMGLSATYANAQGNTLPIIWGAGKNWGPNWKEANRPAWIPLHERYFNPFDSGDRAVEPKCVTENNCSIGSGECPYCPVTDI